MKVRILFRVCAWLLLLGAGPAIAQTISDFSPKAGAPGDSVLITGSGYSVGTIKIYFWNGRLAPAPGIASDTTLTVQVPSGITTGPLGIQRDNGPILYTAGNYLAIGSGPFISAVSPQYGSPDDPITIYGAHLTNANWVKFNGVASTYVNPSADGSQISTRVPWGSTNGYISVNTPYGTSNSPAPFTVLGPGPFISGFTPTSTLEGYPVYVDGVHFTTVTNVFFHGVAGTGLYVQGDTRVQITPPSGVTSGPITVNSPQGSYTTTSNYFAPPVITAMLPGNGEVGSSITITGRSLLGSSAVTFNGTATTFSINTAGTAISARIPNNATTGPLRVIAPAGSAFGPSNFVVLPQVSGFSPTKGPQGTPVTVYGVNLWGANQVKFGGVNAGAPSGVTYSQLTTTVPSGAKSGPITVVTTNGTAVSAGNFYLPPSITSFNPNTGSAGTAVSITGVNFTDASDVKFFDTSAMFLFNSDTSLTAFVPVNVHSGEIVVTTPGGTALSSTKFYGYPSITSFNPSHGLPGNIITITGVNFTDATAVQFNGTTAGFTVTSPTQLTATVPPNAQTGPITILAPGGSATSSTNFVLDYTSDITITTFNSSPQPVTVGSNLDYSVFAYNNGPYDSPNTRVTTVLPPTVTCVYHTPSYSWETNGNTLTANLGTLVRYNPTELHFKVIPNVAGNISAVATVESGYPDPVPGNNSRTNGTTVLPLALLTITRPATNQVRVSWPVMLTNYSLQAENELLTNGVWSTVTNPPVVTPSERYLVQTNSFPARYYRLIK